MRIDDYITDDERKVIEYLRNKNRMEQDEILKEQENGNTLRNDNTGKRII